MSNQIIEHRILLVEDDVLYRLQIKRYLTRFREIIEAGSIGEACEKLIDNPDIDLILLDLGLPDSDGVSSVDQILKFIEGAEHVEEIPVVVLTGSDDEEMWVKSMVAGAQEYLEKQRTNDAYVIEKTVRSAIFRKAQEATIVHDRRQWKLSHQQYWLLQTRLGSLIHSLPNKQAYDELRAIFKAADKVERTASRE